MQRGTMMNYIINKNPDETVFNEISEIIKNNDNHCCCSVLKNSDSLCMCKEFRDQNEGGFCHCGRYYKVKDYPTITIIHAPADEEYANSLACSLTRQGFLVTIPFYRDAMQYVQNQEIYQDMQKTKIDRADLVFVLNTSEEAVAFLEEQICWAEDLKKKIIYEHNEEVKEDEA